MKATRQRIGALPTRIGDFAAWRGPEASPRLVRACRALGLTHQARFGDWTVWCHARPTEHIEASLCANTLDDVTSATFTSRGAKFRRALSGGAPIHYHEGDGSLFVCTRMVLFTTGLGLTEINPLAAAMWFGGHPTFPNGQTTLRGVRSVPPGYELEAPHAGPISTNSYWTAPSQATKPPTTVQFEAHAAELLEALKATIKTEVASTRTLACYSGGVDSSLLVSLAQQQGTQLSALTFTPSLHAPNASHELAWIHQSTITQAFEHHDVIELPQRLWVSTIRDAPPSVFPITYHASLFLPRVTGNRRFATVLRGEFADETCGSRLRLADWLAACKPTTFLSRASAWPLGARTPLSALLLRARRARRITQAPPLVELPAIFHHDLRAKHAEWRRDFIATSPGLARLDTRDGILTEAWESAGALGLHTCFPFMSRRVLELAYQLHPEELIGRTTKHILRRAARGAMLESQRLRGDKGLLSEASTGPNFELPPLSSACEALLSVRWLERATQNGVNSSDALRLTGLQHMIESSQLLGKQDTDDH